MRLKLSNLTCLWILFVLSTQSAAQMPDPLTGRWTGDWGPSPKDRNPVTVELKWDGKTLTGEVTGKGNVAGPETDEFPYTIPFKKSSFDVSTGKLRLEADAFFAGHKVHYVIDGLLADRLLSGTWKHGDKKGNFRLLKS